MYIQKKIFSFIICGTILLLLYVHVQTEIFRVSYSIGKKERELVQLSEQYKIARFRNERLRSPEFLDKQMKHCSLDLTNPKVADVIKVKIDKVMTPAIEPKMPAKTGFLAALSAVKEAQAKPSK
ncbi:MAG: hypothetical protein A3G33_11475 [Omnitrophica bacterium RIFCSPLOWO2_12_FULL_44_17]|uniref:Cell division protein FtsL n=1 Tax=Candidatus Danuiimicrobium aquiferis TaxID=1801832 RepID=A0A1G1KSR3_9BACT|nr:MAG: hypothetical protein A3B72_09315 [Omnitrophica bacterium RIFCSPHIGHO2_02_FULL_45_28]OGW91208.1 MAG: hypothetical protein A3E74_02845 [Omnitrophica bacterium RIFCSPHIGHO2_12_FULL_44_12]OGW95609.1 MAG: hypothetical protein A3G33_11475 [Omnitrophica bacterium RIFCSPLOWO2_12_FULL_44_17]OGX03678.1 MAG: hypothetical protein A3J12_01020 [Omnitrophica bacterium RIFCSPLOWO2_02_FULL_44_11]